jgi:biotin/methionine sulfoxide reductase
VAMMMGLAHTLIAENLHDRAFLETHTVGFERLRAYLVGETDGTPKDADWAAYITQIPAPTIRTLARQMARMRTMIAVSWSVQRADHGEQPDWMAIALAAMLGQIGLPGGGSAGEVATAATADGRQPGQGLHSGGTVHRYAA